MIYAINYDLKKPGRDYSGLYQAIKRTGAWWHYLGSTWLVDTKLDAAGVWKELAKHIDKNDRMLIIGVTKDYQGWLPKDAWDWIRSRRHRAAA
jgi:hypothetical protein